MRCRPLIRERRISLVGPYRELYETLMSYDPLWVPPAIGEDDDYEYPMHEVSLEGPAGTGKTYAEGVILEALHSRYPNIRTVVIRKTRSSLTNSFMQVFEDNVLGPGHPALARQINRKNRSDYVWWNGGIRSETILAGMDANNLARLYSTQYDVAFLVEAIEFTEDEYESIYRAMRNPGVPFKAIICDTNPGNPQHFLNRRPERENATMRRVRTKHWHNPRYFNPVTKKWTGQGKQYIGKILNQYTGVRRKRMLEGIWCSAAGAIWENFDPKYHVVERGEITPEKPHGANLPDFEYFIGALDLGWNDAKCLQIWGVTKHRHAYRVAEWYGRRVTDEMLTRWLLEAHEEYDFVRCVSDHDPEKINLLNTRLGWREKRARGNLVTRAKKGPGSVYAGNMLVKDLLGDPENGVPSRVFLVDGAVRTKCKESLAEGLPWCTEMEIPGYVWGQDKDGNLLDKPDDGCEDHGCDTKRYALTEIWYSDFRSERSIREAEPDREWTDVLDSDMTDEEKEAWLAEHDL